MQDEYHKRVILENQFTGQAVRTLIALYPSPALLVL